MQQHYGAIDWPPESLSIEVGVESIREREEILSSAMIEFASKHTRCCSKTCIVFLGTLYPSKLHEVTARFMLPKGLHTKKYCTSPQNNCHDVFDEYRLVTCEKPLSAVPYLHLPRRYTSLFSYHLKGYSQSYSSINLNGHMRLSINCRRTTKVQKLSMYEYLS